MSQAVEIYLGKNSQTFGPYTVEQFEEIKASADFATYTFIWDGREADADWKPLEKAPAPPAPVRKAGPGAPPPDSRATRAPATREREEAPAPAVAAPVSRVALKGYDVPGIEALCHDSIHVIAGKLTQVTDSGCELICPQNSVAPGFGSKSPVVLNLLEPKTGRSMNVSARLSAVRRREGQWSLKVLWNGCPELIVQLLEKTA
jgi:hypothetical protein